MLWVLSKHSFAQALTIKVVVNWRCSPGNTVPRIIQGKAVTLIKTSKWSGNHYMSPCVLTVYFQRFFSKRFIKSPTKDLRHETYESRLISPHHFTSLPSCGRLSPPGRTNNWVLSNSWAQRHWSHSIALLKKQINKQTTTGKQRSRENEQINPEHISRYKNV